MQRNKALVLLSGNLLGTRIRIFSSFVISNWMNLCAFCKYWSRWRLRLFIYIDQKAGKLCHRPNTWKLSEKHLSHKYLLLVIRAANVCLTTDADTELWWTQGTELKYAANVHWSCLFPRWPSCPRVIPDVHVSLERVDAHVSKGLIVWRKWRVNRWTVFILTPKETNPSDKKASV